MNNRKAIPKGEPQISHPDKYRG